MRNTVVQVVLYLLAAGFSALVGADPVHLDLSKAGDEVGLYAFTENDILYLYPSESQARYTYTIVQPKTAIDISSFQYMSFFVACSGASDANFEVSFEFTTELGREKSFVKFVENIPVFSASKSTPQSGQFKLVKIGLARLSPTLRKTLTAVTFSHFSNTEVAFLISNLVLDNGQGPMSPGIETSAAHETRLKSLMEMVKNNYGPKGNKIMTETGLSPEDEEALLADNTNPNSSSSKKKKKKKKATTSASANATVSEPAEDTLTTNEETASVPQAEPSVLPDAVPATEDATPAVEMEQPQPTPVQSKKPSQPNYSVNNNKKKKKKSPLLEKLERLAAQMKTKEEEKPVEKAPAVVEAEEIAAETKAEPEGVMSPVPSLQEPILKDPRKYRKKLNRLARLAQELDQAAEPSDNGSNEEVEEQASAPETMSPSSSAEDLAYSEGIQLERPPSAAIDIPVKTHPLDEKYLADISTEDTPMIDKIAVAESVKSDTDSIPSLTSHQSSDSLPFSDADFSTSSSSATPQEPVKIGSSPSQGLVKSHPNRPPKTLLKATAPSYIPKTDQNARKPSNAIQKVSPKPVAPLSTIPETTVSCPTPPPLPMIRPVYSYLGWMLESIDNVFFMQGHTPMFSISQKYPLHSSYPNDEQRQVLLNLEVLYRSFKDQGFLTLSYEVAQVYIAANRREIPLDSVQGYINQWCGQLHKKLSESKENLNFHYQLRMNWQMLLEEMKRFLAKLEQDEKSLVKPFYKDIFVSNKKGLRNFVDSFGSIIIDMPVELLHLVRDAFARHTHNLYTYTGLKNNHPPKRHDA